MTDWAHSFVKTVMVFVIGLALGMLAEHHWRAGKDAVAAAKVADQQLLAIQSSVTSQADRLQRQLAVEQDHTAALLADQRARARAAVSLHMEISNAVFISPPDAHGCTDPLGSAEFERLYEAARQAGGTSASAGSAATR